MNTDNMSILGLTLDYGPFGFLDAFDPGYICNHSDTGGRYAFDQQPDVAAWNITKLAQALVPLMSVETASQAIGEYPQVFGKAYLERMAAKFGLPPGSETASSSWTPCNCWRRTTSTTRSSCAACAISTAARKRPTHRCATSSSTARPSTPGPHATPPRCASRVGRRRTQHGNARVNPKYILRNHLAEIAIRRAADESRLQRGRSPARAADASPFDEQPENEAYAAEPPDWARKIEVSCSS
jgi:serine/tyrosine/threonine adenylyltransferase